MKKVTKVLKNFWVLEGLDGSGTTTQLNKIDNLLNSKNIKHFITQEPTDNEIGKLIRRILSGEIPARQSTIAHLFAADRDDHLFNEEYGIIKHLNDNEIVISDRYLFSSLAYQSINYDYAKVKELNIDFPLPEYVIYIDLSAETCLERINSRGGKKEIFEKLDYQKKVQFFYNKCLSELSDDCHVLQIDGSKSKEEVFADICNQLKI